MNVRPLHVALALASSSIGCASSSDAVVPAPDAGPCTSVWTPYVATRGCVNARASIAVCIADTTTKSVYELCAASPEGQLYWGAVSSASARITAPGWTFGPSTAVGFLGLAPMSASDEATCEAILANKPAACAR